MGEARAATEMRPGKMAAAEMSVTAAEVHVAAAVTTTVATAMTPTMASASRQRDAARRQGDGNNERNKSGMEFRHRSLPPATRDITINRRQRDARQPGSRG
jgi:hypothetical protein